MPAPSEKVSPYIDYFNMRTIAADWFGRLLLQEKTTLKEKVSFEDIQNKLAKTVEAQAPQEFVEQLGFDNPQLQWWEIKGLTFFCFAVPKDSAPDIQAALATTAVASRSIARFKSRNFIVKPIR